MKLHTHGVGLVVAAGSAAVLVPAAAFAQPFAITWSSIDSGGTTSVAAGVYTLGGTIGQPEAGLLSAGTLQILGGYWGAATAVCYANCDGSTTTPALNANDFQCFLNAFAANQSYANCDGSTSVPVLNANDFQCFLNAFAAGCP